MAQTVPFSRVQHMKTGTADMERFRQDFLWKLLITIFIMQISRHAIRVYCTITALLSEATDFIRRCIITMRMTEERQTEQIQVIILIT